MLLTVATDVASEVLLTAENNITSNIVEDIAFLEFAIEPWESVTLKWKTTAKHRVAAAKETNDIVAYMRKYPCLLTNAGYKLVRKYV